MLTPKQNMLEVIKGGNPDRFVNQYEAVQLLFHPFMFTNPLLQPGQENVVNDNFSESIKVSKYQAK